MTGTPKEKMNCPRVLLFNIVVVVASNLAIGIRVLENCVLDHLALLVLCQHSRQQMQFYFGGVIFADAVKSEHIAAVDTSTRRNRQPISRLSNV